MSREERLRQLELERNLFIASTAHLREYNSDENSGRDKINNNNNDNNDTSNNGNSEMSRVHVPTYSLPLPVPDTHNTHINSQNSKNNNTQMYEMHAMKNKQERVDDPHSQSSNYHPLSLSNSNLTTSTTTTSPSKLNSNANSNSNAYASATPYIPSVSENLGISSASTHFFNPSTSLHSPQEHASPASSSTGNAAHAALAGLRSKLKSSPEGRQMFTENNLQQHQHQHQHQHQQHHQNSHTYIHYDPTDSPPLSTSLYNSLEREQERDVERWRDRERDRDGERVKEREREIEREMELIKLREKSLQVQAALGKHNLQKNNFFSM
jgi:hypothetical protein